MKMSEDSIYYDSYKEDRDLVLEYNQESIDNIGLVNIAGIGIYNITRTQAVAKVLNMIEEKGVHHIISLNPYKVRRISSNADLRLISNKADMHLAGGAGLEWASAFLKTPLKATISHLSFIMELIRICEIKEYSIFLVGGKPETVERAFFNIKKSFPKIRIVGRHGGYFNNQREKSVVEAMRKSEPDIILVGLGFPKEDQWIHSIKKEFANTVFVSAGGSFDVISGESKKAPTFFINRDLEWFFRIISKPWRIGRLIRTAAFFISIIFKRVLKRY